MERTEGRKRQQKEEKGGLEKKQQKRLRKTFFPDWRDLCEKAAVVQESWKDSGMLIRRL